jgi:tetratricopeptide (TPR) repeat protein
MSLQRSMKIALFVLFFLGFPLLLRSQSAAEFFLFGQEQIDKGNYAEALILTNKSIRLDSSKSDYYLQRATIFYNLAKYDDAIKDCYSSLKIEADKPEVYYLRGQICLVTESYGGAIVFFNKTIKSAKKNDLLLNAFVNRGNAYSSLGKLNEAHDDFMKAYELDHESIVVLIHLAENYYSLKQTNEALTILDKAILNQPDNPQIYELLGRISVDNKDFPKAIESFKKFCTLKPTDARIASLLAQAYLEVKDYPEALLSVNHALTLDPSDPANYKLKGMILLEKGQVEEGCNCFFKAMQLGYLEKNGYDLLDIYLQRCENK